jgi:hypothetical protein
MQFNPSTEYVVIYTAIYLSPKIIALPFRTSPAEFVVPCDHCMESLKRNYSIGMRFKMRFEGEEAPEQR